MQRPLVAVSMIALLGMGVGCPPSKKPNAPATGAGTEAVTELVGNDGTSLLVSKSGWIVTVASKGDTPPDFGALATLANECAQGTCGAVARPERVAAVCAAFRQPGLGQLAVGGTAAIVARMDDQISLAWPRDASPEAVLGPAGLERIGELRAGTQPAPCDPAPPTSTDATGPTAPPPSPAQPECTWPPIIPPRFCF